MQERRRQGNVGENGKGRGNVGEGYTKEGEQWGIKEERRGNEEEDGEFAEKLEWWTGVGSGGMGLKGGLVRFKSRP